MDYTIIVILAYLLVSVVIGFVGISRKIGFLGAFGAALFLTPLFGILITLASKHEVMDQILDELKKLNASRETTGN